MTIRVIDRIHSRCVKKQKSHLDSAAYLYIPLILIIAFYLRLRSINGEYKNNYTKQSQTITECLLVEELPTQRFQVHDDMMRRRNDDLTVQVMRTQR